MKNITTKIAQSLTAFLIDDKSLTNAVLEGCNNPAKMQKHVFLGLQKLEENMERSAARGEDCTEGFDADRDEINRLLQASPWTLHPDHGCVLAVDIANLDNQTNTASPVGTTIVSVPGLPDFDVIKDKRMSELTVEQQEDAREGWLRKQFGWFLGAKDHLKFLLDRLDAVRISRLKSMDQAAPKIKWFSVTGRLPGDHTDTRHLFQVADRDDAIQAFETAMYKNESKRSREDVLRLHGKCVFLSSIVSSESPIVDAT